MNNNLTSLYDKFKRHAVLYAAVVIFVLIALLVSRYLFHTGQIEVKQEEILNVSRQSFRLEVIARGVVRPACIIPIKSQISGNQAKLIWVLPEGQQVKKGLLIARFDTKPLMDIMQKAEQQLADAKAQLENSLKALELLKEAGKSAEENVRRKLEIAKIKANDLKNGSGPLKRKQLKQAVTQAGRDTKILTQEREDLKPLMKNGHVTQREYEKADNAYIAAREALEIFRAELANFDKYEWPRIMREAEVIIDAAQIDLARVQRTTELEQQQQLSKIENYRRALKNNEKALKNAQREVAACDIYSPADGILLYSQLPQHGKNRSIMIGDSIWKGQTLLEVPDTSNLVIETDIREIDVSKLAPGMSVEIRLDAYPGQVFAGTLTTIDDLAQEDDNNASMRSFFTKISFLEPNTAIHVGMSASVKIIYKELQDVLAVPAGAITYYNGKKLVKQLIASERVLTEVTIGDSGIKWVEIQEGLNENDSIVIGTF